MFVFKQLLISYQNLTENLKTMGINSENNIQCYDVTLMLMWRWYHLYCSCQTSWSYKRLLNNLCNYKNNISPNKAIKLCHKAQRKKLRSSQNSNIQRQAIRKAPTATEKIKVWCEKACDAHASKLRKCD